ncbi:MAG: sodium:panthothenate symporter, partial [Lentisphaeria bacterium]|nr:sodium:panthothenate symporter [Lentisphaeria bacterium]
VQTFRTIYQQMIVPLATREILPMGITGIFCALMIFLLLSTDTTYLHSWGSIIVQDFVVPLRKKAFTPEQQLRTLRITIAGVAVFVFLFSLFFAQIDYIAMFFMITGAIWSGAGVVITLGLYWSRGTSAGAFSALILGAAIALTGIFGQYYWAGYIYPWLEGANLLEPVQEVLTAISKPFNPYIVWEVNPRKFPINSQEIAFIANTATVIIYMVVSLVTCRTPFNMERMLHRGIYADDQATQLKKEPFSFRNLVFRKMVGIDSNYTTGDKILAWSVFVSSFGIFFLSFFVGVVIWDLLDPWTANNWSTFFFVKSILYAGCVGIVTTIWFSICGTRDLCRLFKDLASKEANALDDGRVIGNISAADLAKVAEAEKQSTEKKDTQEEK